LAAPGEGTVENMAMKVGVMTHAAEYARAIARDGYAIREGVLNDNEVARLQSAVAAIPAREEVRRRRGVYGVRNLLEICPAVCELATAPAIRWFATAVLGEAAFAVRAIFFDKVPGANWSLFWHQDNVVAVRGRRDAPGFVGWSQKAGVWQVQPPAEVLAGMVAVRVHLDDCGAGNGPLRVLPGSHDHGWLDEAIDDWKARVLDVCCTVGRGGVVVIRPLILHASAAAETAEHRRVIHIEYAARDLPEGLEWNHRIVPSRAVRSGPANRAREDVVRGHAPRGE
jgi:ectoine hydroxylase-related dioxygenase (phytanoyl-CoA dioxygenase family)